MSSRPNVRVEVGYRLSLQMILLAVAPGHEPLGQIRPRRGRFRDWPGLGASERSGISGR
jgi:hypothetical protein